MYVDAVLRYLWSEENNRAVAGMGGGAKRKVIIVYEERILFVFATDIGLLMRIIQLREIDVQNGGKRQGLAGSERGGHIA